MIVQAVAIWLTVAVPKYPAWIVAALIQGLGTAMLYPTLLAAISDVAHPEWRASTMGVYRFWRDLGYAIGALISGIIADLLGMRAAIQVVAALTLISGLYVAIRMRETLMRGPERGLGGILVSPVGDWNSDHDHSNDSRSAREVL
jgi:MFS family permease